VNLPSAMRGRLSDAVEPLRAGNYPVKWVQAEALHVTIRFLGEVDEDKRDPIQQALVAAVGDTRAFNLPVGEFGTFPPVKQPRVIWVGCETPPALELVADGVERQLAGVGFPVEGRPFRPHVTIGRVRRDARPGQLEGLRDQLASLEFFEEPNIESVDLMRSHLGPNGPRYERLFAAELVR
jgi:2'-5' RNA ligase